MIRASIDKKIPNESMKRSQCIQSPRVEDLIYHPHDCKIFTKLDQRQGLDQLAQDHTTKKVPVATFSTPRGNWSLEIKIHRMSLMKQHIFRIFGDIPDCLNQRDDILPGGRDLQS